MLRSPARRRNLRLRERLGAIIFAVLTGSCIIRQPESAKRPGGSSERIAPSVATQYARLSHLEWANSLRELFQMDFSEELEANLRPDPLPAGSVVESPAAALGVDDALWRDYQRAAAQVARRVTESPEAVARLLPAGATESERVRRFLLDFGRKVHRRPLSEQQVTEYLALFEAGRTSEVAAGSFETGLRLVLQALLQSPHFLYRMEVGTARDDKLWLDPHELGSRLSYALWDTMPDAELFARADSGELSNTEVFAAEAARLLDDSRARPTLGRFHAQLFESERARHAAPAPGRFKNISASFGASAARESELYVDYQIFERNAGYRELLSSSESFVNAELARVYGVAGSFGDTFARVELDRTRRRGLLTHTAFLASHATSVDPDPIHRGVFVARRLLCLNLVAPGNLPPLPPKSGLTNRAAVEAHTEREGSGCAVCHRRTINPLGFPFEMFDAIGAYRTHDAGQPVDTHSRVRLDGEELEVADALGLADALAQSPQAHTCYARHMLEFLYGRTATKRDGELLAQLGERSARGDISVKQLMLELLASPEFKTLDPGDLQ